MAAVAIVAGANGTEVRMACLEQAEAPNACLIIENVNVTANDTIVITNADQFQDATEFEMKDSNWEVIPSSIFTTFPHLHRIEMTVNLKRLVADAFVGADNLHTIQLRGNQIEEIPHGAFTGAPVSRLILSENKIRNIDDGAFDGLADLEYAYFTRNELRVIRNGTFGGALKLRRIELDRNQIETIETDAFRLPNLQYIDLGHNKLKSLTADVFNVAPILKTLLLNDNELWQVNEWIAKLTVKKLYALVLANNPVDSINLGQIAPNLPKLENLNLCNTTSIVYVEVSNATKTGSRSALEALDLSNNNLTQSDIISVVEIFPQLADLNLEMNSFTKIDGLDHIQRTFPELRTLFIGCNRFDCEWLANALQTVNVTLDVLSCPDPTINTAKNVRNVDCV